MTRAAASAKFYLGLCYACVIFGLGWLVIILGTLMYEGFRGLSPAVFTQMTPPPGSNGGLLNAIVGSLIMTVLGVAVGTPLGMLAGTYMAEYGRHTKLTFVVRFINDILLSAPSIVIGLFIYEVMVAKMGHFSALAGAVALAVIVVPVVVRTTEDMLLLVPDQLREAASALGLPRSIVIGKVAYRAARAGLITGVLLADRPHQRRDRALALHRAEQSVLQHESERADVEPAGRHLSVRAQSLQGMAAACLDWRTHHHRGRADAFHQRARAPGTKTREMTGMNDVSNHAPIPELEAPAVAGKLSHLEQKVTIRDLKFYYGDSLALKNISLPLYANKVTAFIGPSGCGKSTLLRVLNRMYDLYPKQRAEGEVLLDGVNILRPEQDLNLLRARVGMVFQKPTPFPMSIYDNIAFGIKLYEKLSKSRARRPGRDRLGARRSLGRGQGQIERLRPVAFGRPAAAPLHRPHRRDPAGSYFVRRTLLGARPDLDGEDRGNDRRIEGKLYDRDRHAQHAAGGARLGIYGLHVSRRTHRVRRHRAYLHVA